MWDLISDRVLYSFRSKFELASGSFISSFTLILFHYFPVELWYQSEFMHVITEKV